MSDKLETCKKAFEDWYTDGKLDCPSIRHDGDKYLFTSAYLAWNAWQAAWNSKTASQSVDVESLKKEIISWAFSECQPNRGDVFSWLDDNIDTMLNYLAASGMLAKELEAVDGLDEALNDIEVFLEIADFTKFGSETIQPVIDAACKYQALTARVK